MELPGVDDPAHVKELIGATGAAQNCRREERRPWKTKEEALAAKGGILPLNTELLDRPAGGNGRRLVSCLAHAGDHRTGYAQRPRRHRSAITRAAGRPDLPFRRMARASSRTSPGANIGNRLAVVLDNQIRSVATIQSAISDSGPHQRTRFAAGSVRSGSGAEDRRAAGGNQLRAGAHHRPVAGRGFHP